MEQYADLLVPAAAVAGVLVVLLAVVLVARRRRKGRPGLAAPTTLAAGLRETSRRLRERLDAVLGRDRAPGSAGDVYAELEEVLLGSDLGVRTTETVLRDVQERVSGDTRPEVVRAALKDALLALLPPSTPPESGERPRVILVTGVNGVGKTTTIGKLAARYVKQGLRVLLVAGDTFRAAAIDQLGIWAERAGAEIVRHRQGADPSAVAFDGMKAAVSRNLDVVLVDSAGRLHTHGPLMDELRKVSRVLAREIPGAPHETLLVLDATTGQNAVNQARVFKDAVEVTGVVLTKLDGTARGGVVVSICYELGIPLRYVGVGEGTDDLQDFEPREFVEALFGETDGSDGAGILTPTEAGH
jgi:fused signal recognition particle receptor